MVSQNLACQEKITRVNDIYKMNKRLLDKEKCKGEMIFQVEEIECKMKEVRDLIVGN